MAWVYEVCQLRNTGYSANANNSGGQKSCQLTLNQKYIVIVTDPSDSNFHGSQVNDIHAAAAKDSVTNVRIPQVNYNTYYDPVANVSVPLAVCTSKTVTRKQENTAVFEVNCSFQTGGGSGGGGGGGAKQGKAQEFETPQDPEPQEPPTNVTDIVPVVTRSVVGRDIVLNSAQAYGADGLGEDLDLGVRSTRYLPTLDTFGNGELSNEIDQPITRKQPLLQITVTQFEDTFTDQNLLERCFRVNTQEYRGFPIKSAMITAINAVEQEITVKDGAGVAQEVWHRVTYNIMIDEYSAKDSTGTSLFIGHAHGVPLIGHWYFDENGDARQFLVGEETGIGNVGLITVLGERLGDPGVGGNQLGAPDYVRFDTVDEIDFEGFMQA